MAKQTLDIIIDAQTPGVAKVAKASADIKKELSGLKGLKAGLGEESSFGGTFKALQGAGAVAGLSLAGQTLAKLSEATGQFQKDLNDSNVTAGEMTEKLAKGIPIIGGFVEAGRNWRTQLDGSAAAIEKINAENAQIDAKLKGQKEFFELRDKAQEKYITQLKEINNQIALIGLDPLTGARTSLRQGLAGQYESIDKARGEERAGLAGSASGNRDRLIKQLRASPAGKAGSLEREVFNLSQKAAEAELKRINEMQLRVLKEFDQQTLDLKKAAAKRAQLEDSRLLRENADKLNAEAKALADKAAEEAAKAQEERSRQIREDIERRLEEEAAEEKGRLSIQEKFAGIFGRATSALFGGHGRDPDAPLGGRPGFQSFRVGAGSAGFSPLEHDAARQTADTLKSIKDDVAAMKNAVAQAVQNPGDFIGLFNPPNA